MYDRTTKAILIAIALGLWMNVGTQWLRPAPVSAASQIDYAAVARINAASIGSIEGIGKDIHMVVMGLCLNKKIC